MTTTYRRISRFASALAVLAWLLTAALPATADPARVDLNSATEEELVALPGIGPAKARAILEYREEHPFGSVEELRNVRGIGEHTFESLKDKVTVGAASGSAKH